MVDFKEHWGALADIGVQVVAMSADPEEEARKTMTRHELPFAVGYGLDVRHIIDLLGVFGEATPPPGYEEKSPQGFLHASAFIVHDGVVIHSTSSSGPLGRLRAEDAVNWITWRQGAIR